MKRNSFVFLILLIVSGHLFAQEKSSGLLFEERVFDFGEINEKDGKIFHIFKFENTGKEFITIDRVISGCGCISHTYTRNPVKPGERGEIKISYDPYSRPGFFSKEIVIFSNKRQYINRVWIKGNVIPFQHPVEEDYPYAYGEGLHTNLKVLAFGRLQAGDSREIELRYANDTDRPMVLTFENETNDPNIKYENPGRLEPKERGKMIVKYTMNKASGNEIQVDIYPVVNGKKLQQPLVLKVTGYK